MTKPKDTAKIWMISDKMTVHLDDRIIPRGTPFQGDASLIERGIARKANRDEIGDSDAE